MELDDLMRKLEAWQSPLGQWRWLAAHQKQCLLDQWRTGTLDTGSLTSALGMGCDGTKPELAIAEYCTQTGRTLAEIVAMVAPVPMLGTGRDDALECQGHRFDERHVYAAHYARALPGEGQVVEIGGGMGYLPIYAQRLVQRPWVGIDLWPALIHQYLVMRPHLPVTVMEPGPILLMDASEIREEWIQEEAWWVNTDSFPELPGDAVLRYMDLAKAKRARGFYSVNNSRWPRPEGWTIRSSVPFPRTHNGSYVEEWWEPCGSSS